MILIWVFRWKERKGHEVDFLWKWIYHISSHTVCSVYFVSSLMFDNFFLFLVNTPFKCLFINKSGFFKIRNISDWILSTTTKKKEKSFCSFSNRINWKIKGFFPVISFIYVGMESIIECMYNELSAFFYLFGYIYELFKL